MSRVNTNSGKRCANCGGRMRLVNVTWINKFQTPEASQYDRSVSYRKAMLGDVFRTSAQEMMCTCCGQRAPISIGKSAKAGKPVKAKKTAKVKKEKKTKEKKSRKERRARRKCIIGFIKFLVFLIIVAIIAYFAYQNQEVLNTAFEQVKNILEKLNLL